MSQNKRNRRRLLRLLFRVYTWVESIGWTILNLCPPIIRRLVFAIVVGEIGRETTVDYGTYIRYPWRVKIGSSTTINRGCRFFPSFFHKDVTIQIGSHVAVAAGVSFVAAGHDYTSRWLPDTAASISVGDWVWIGANATILPGVSIGEGAVIGAGSVVTRDVPPWTIAVGVPARVTKQRVLEEDTP